MKLTEIEFLYRAFCTGTTQADICGFFNGALLAVNAQTGFTDLTMTSDKPQLLPVEKCEGLQDANRYCFLELRSHEWAVLCLKLDGEFSALFLPLRGS